MIFNQVYADARFTGNASVAPEFYQLSINYKIINTFDSRQEKDTLDIALA